VGNGSVDLVGGDALVVAVVPFGEIAGLFVDGDARQLGGAAGAHPGTGERERGVGAAVQHGVGAAGGVCLTLADAGQGDVGVTRVLARGRPLGLAVPDEEKRVFGHGCTVSAHSCYWRVMSPV